MSTQLENTTPVSLQQKRALLEQLLRQADEVQTRPLSYGQKALYFLHQSDPESPAYHVAFSARFRSPVDAPALRRALQGLVDRHEQLRVKFRLQNGEPVQESIAQLPVALQIVDARTWTDEQVDAEVRKAYQQPFDLEQGPVFRGHLFTLAENDHVFLLTIHHIVYDAWSLWLNQEELLKLYAAEVTGVPAALPMPEKSYQHFVGRQIDMLASAEGDALWAYWKDCLSGELPTLNLPTDRPRPALRSSNGASRKFHVRPETTARLRSLAQRREVTPFMLYLAAFQVLLHRYSGQDDILVGSPSAGRNSPYYANTVGYFVNPLVLRADLSGNPTFADFLNKTRDKVLGALEHQDLPFPVLVERLQPKRDPSYSPLFQASFVYQRSQRADGILSLVAGGGGDMHLASGGLAIEHYDLPQQEGQFDLELELIESGAGLGGVFKYNTDLFDAETIDRMLGHFETLLDSALGNPDTPVGMLNLLPKQEWLRLIRSFNATGVEYDLARPLHAWIEAQAARTPEAIALTFEGAHLSYRELEQRGNQLANYLRAAGIGRGDVVAVCMERSLELVIALLATLKAGAAYLPLDPALPSERIHFMLEDAAPVFILTQTACLARLPEQAIPFLALDADWSRVTGMSATKADIEVKPQDSAYVIYTSGSTGKPKGAINSHKGICNRLLWMQEAYDLGPSDCVLQKTPFTFDVSVWEFFWPLMTGARLVIAKPEGHKDSAYLADLIVREAITTLHFVPPMLQTFLQEPRARDCRALRRVICSGEALPLDLQRRFQDLLPAELHNLYGPTEAAVDVTYWACDRDDARNYVPIGRPIANTQIYILDKWGQPTPIGVPGELHIAGVNVGLGYLNRPELTAERFIRDPFAAASDAVMYKTGDLARWRQDGVIEYLGRLDFQVKLRGFRIELGEIEQCLCQYPEVVESVVVTRTAPCGDVCLVGYVTGPEATPEQCEAMRRFLKERLPEYFVPSALLVLERFPLSHNGKIDRAALPLPELWNGGAREVVAPKDDLERALAAIWQAVLGLDAVGREDNFFDLGGHSLRAIRLMAEIKNDLGLDLPLATLLRAPTIAQLAEVVRARQAGDAWSPLVPIQCNGGAKPFFCVAGGGGSVLYFQGLARHLSEEQPFYGLQAKGLDGEAAPFERVEEMAACYLDAIRSVQPQGPYRLGGHCFGAIVAFEMAQQLLKRGEQVESLIVLNVPAPGMQQNKATCVLDDAAWVVKLGRLLEQSSGLSLNLDYAELRALGYTEQLDYLRQRMQQAGFLPPEAGIAPVRGLLEVLKANGRIKYQPEQPLPVPIALLRAEGYHVEYDFSDAENTASGARDSTLGWQKFAWGPVAIHPVPGDHITMLSEPNVERLAVCLRAALAGERPASLAVKPGVAMPARQTGFSRPFRRPVSLSRRLTSVAMLLLLASASANVLYPEFKSDLQRLAEFVHFDAILSRL